MFLTHGVQALVREVLVLAALYLVPVLYALIGAREQVTTTLAGRRRSGRRRRIDPFSVGVTRGILGELHFKTHEMSLDCA